MATRAEPSVRAVSLPLTLQILLVLAVTTAALAIAGLAGAALASLPRPTRRLDLSRLSGLPLTNTALIAELDPSRVAGPPPAAPSPAAATAPAPAPPPAAPVAAAPSPAAVFSPGEAALVNETGSQCVNVRATPGLSGEVLRCLPAGTNLRILAGPSDGDGYRWWSVDAGGWVAEDFLTAASPPPSTAPSAVLPVSAAPASAQRLTGGYTGWATYYGIEDGFVRGDIMYDGTPFDPANPTIAAASFLIPLHTWLLVCSTAGRCIVVEVRDRGLLDQNGILLDLSRGAYAALFGGLGGKQMVSALYIDPGIMALFPSLTALAAP